MRDLAPQKRSRRELTFAAAAIVVVASIVLLPRCAPHGETRPADELADALRSQQIERIAATFAVEARDRAWRDAARRATGPTLEELLGRPAELGLERDPIALDVARSVYSDRNFEPVFVGPDGLTSAGDAVAQALAGADRHGLDPVRYQVPAIESHRTVVRNAERVRALRRALDLSLEEEALVVAWLEGRRALDGTYPTTDELFATISRTGDGNPVPRFAETLSELEAALAGIAVATTELELLLAHGFLRYARDMRVDNLAWVPAAERDERGWEGDPEHDRELAARPRLEHMMRSAIREQGFDAVLSALVPPYAEYARLMAGLAEYRGYVETGGWAPLEIERTLRQGHRGEEVQRIRSRLAAERYLAVDAGGERFDEDLEDALLWYQRTHQLMETGTLTEATRYSLDISAEQRVAQIIVSLQRWRESRVGWQHDKEHIWVNLPEFQAELWDDGELVHPFKVVVGSRRWGSAGEGRAGYVDATPTFSDELMYVVFNPYWNVPPRIFRDEYASLIEENPEWPLENGFELTTEPTSGQPLLRQLPGPGNALGQVKFIFPNEHDVYMHDTPHQRLFSRPVRAYSHGCMRVEEPMELARLLLARDRGTSMRSAQRLIDEKMESGEEQWYTLRRRIPIHIEYRTVVPDHEGRMMFLADIYRYDGEHVDDLLAAYEATGRLVLPEGEDGSILLGDGIPIPE